MLLGAKSTYGQSKTANVLFTVELERRFAPQGVHAHAVHPGLVGTDSCVTSAIKSEHGSTHG
jgi:NAD(P)-dependent dehydrogenase (short-subunit alcohol dehydrogenase family)